MHTDKNMKPGGMSRPLFAALNILLIGLLAFAIVVLVSSYRQLRLSIQSERADSVRQISALISDRVYQLRQTYVHEAAQTAQVIENTQAEDLNALRTMLRGSEHVVLVDAKGNYRALDGSVPVIADSELLGTIVTGEEPSTSFATIQTQGDYWLFAQKLHNVQIGGVTYIGVVLTVSAQEYADVATISLYDRLGESLVVARDGSIKMRPSDTESTSSFAGYNLLKILEKSSMAPAERADFADALQNLREHFATCELNGVTWLLQSVPADGERNLVVLVPVSLTAQSTYRGMTNTLIYAATSIILLAVLFLLNFAAILRKNQHIEVEHARARSKSDFLDKMSHDIRTPLNAIVGMHELALQSMDDKATVYDCLIKAKKSCDYLVGVINDVLDMSRIESGKMTVAHKQFDLDELLDSVVQIESSAATEKAIQLTVQRQTPITTDFVGDAQRLRQCLMNLVNNAVKFTPRGGHITISYAGEPLSDGRVEARFAVADDGVGMSEAFMQHLFKPFEQEQNSLYNAYAGSGLGLSIVHEFVALMGGTITAASKKGEGSTFVISIPLTTARRSDRPEPAVTDAELKKQIAGRRVLLVEDNAVNRQIIAMLLSKMGLLVDEAENGQAAVDKFGASAAGSYALILMDIMMPIMGGLEAAALIRGMQRPDAKSVSIIALSANAFEEDAKKSLAAGMEMHLAKPVDVNELRRVLKKYVH